MMANVFKNNAKHKHEKQKNKFRLPLSAWLSYLVVATLILSSISLARYTVTSTDNDGARLATFTVSAKASGDKDQTIALDPSDRTPGEYEFKVYNDSEVAVRYSILVSGVPNGVNVSLTVGNSTISMTSSENETTDTADWKTDAKELGINQTHTCTLSFAVGEDVENGEYTGIKLQVIVDQAD